MVNSSTKFLLLNCVLFISLIWEPINGQFENTYRYSVEYHSPNGASGVSHTNINSNTNTDMNELSFHEEDNPLSGVGSSEKKGGVDSCNCSGCSNNYGGIIGINMYGLMQKCNEFVMKFKPLLKAVSCFVGKLTVALAQMIMSLVGYQCQSVKCPSDGQLCCQKTSQDFLTSRSTTTTTTTTTPYPSSTQRTTPLSECITKAYCNCGEGSGCSCVNCVNYLTSEWSGFTIQLGSSLREITHYLMEKLIHKVERATECNSSCGNALSRINVYVFMQKFKLLYTKFRPVFKKVFEFLSKIMIGVLKSILSTKFEEENSSNQVTLAPCEQTPLCGDPQSPSNNNNIPMTGFTMKDVFGKKLKKK